MQHLVHLVISKQREFEGVCLRSLLEAGGGELTPLPLLQNFLPLRRLARFAYMCAQEFTITKITEVTALLKGVRLKERFRNAQLLRRLTKHLLIIRMVTFALTLLVNFRK